MSYSLRVKLAGLIVCAALAAGCSLDEGGAPGDAGARDAPAAEAGACLTAASACAGLPEGWSPVAFAESPSSACPAGWGTRAGVESPVAGPSACACACTPTKPTCDGADLDTNISLTGLCLLGQKTLPMASSVCKAIGETNLDYYMKVPPIARTGGGCAPVVEPNTAALSSTPVRECDPTPACQGDLCAGIVPSTYLACVEHDGDQATCPAEFPDRHLVGDAVDPQCNGAACACGSTPACGTPTLSLFSDSACVTKVLDAKVDDNCNSTGAASAKFQSYMYLSTPSIQCTPSGTATASPVPTTTLRTACCR